MTYFVALFLFFFMHFELQGLESFDKLPSKILNHHEQLQIRINRGIDDDLKLHELVRILDAETLVARGVVIDLKEGESVISIYRAYNTSFTLGQNLFIAPISKLDISDSEKKSYLKDVIVEEALSQSDSEEPFTSNFTASQSAKNFSSMNMASIKSTSAIVEVEADEEFPYDIGQKQLELGINPIALNRSEGTKAISYTGSIAKTGTHSASLAYTFKSVEKNLNQFEKTSRIEHDFAYYGKEEVTTHASFTYLKDGFYDSYEGRLKERIQTNLDADYNYDLSRFYKNFSVFTNGILAFEKNRGDEYENKNVSVGPLGIKYYIYEKFTAGSALERIDISYIPVINYSQNSFATTDYKEICSDPTDANGDFDYECEYQDIKSYTKLSQQSVRHRFASKINSIGFFNRRLVFSNSISFEPIQEIRTQRIDLRDSNLANQFEAKLNLIENFKLTYLNKYTSDVRLKRNQNKAATNMIQTFTFVYSKLF